MKQGSQRHLFRPWLPLLRSITLPRVADPRYPLLLPSRGISVSSKSNGTNHHYSEGTELAKRYQVRNDL